MSDDEILSGFTSLQDAIQRGFARLDSHVQCRFEMLEERVARLEVRLEHIERGNPSDGGGERGAGRSTIRRPLVNAS